MCLKDTYFAEFCFLVYELPFLNISGNFPSAALIYKKAEFRKIRYLLNTFLNPCRSTFHRHMTLFHVR